MTRGDALAHLNDDIALLVGDVERGDLATHTFRHQVDRKAVFLDVEDVVFEEDI